MQISRNTFARFSDDLVTGSDELTFRSLQLLSGIASQFAKQPQAQRKLERKFAKTFIRISDDWEKVIDLWINERLPEAYLLGLEESEKVVSQFGARTAIDPIRGKQVFGVGLTSMELSDTAQAILKDYKEHWTFYSTFQKAAKDELGATVFQITRSAHDYFRTIAIQASDVAFTTKDILTRLQQSQEMLNRFADQGITAIRYKNGARVSIENYTEMVGRTMSGNSARQASLNRYSEYGYDLVRMSIHSRCSPMCYPYQGGVFSQSGNSGQYQSLEIAIANGAFHPNCLHSLSPYFPGSSQLLKTSYSRGEQQLVEKYGEKKGTKIAYEAQQTQRYNERMIRKWKKRQAAANTKRTRKKTSKKIRQWQAKQREHLAEFEFLPRKYVREQIKRAH